MNVLILRKIERATSPSTAPTAALRAEGGENVAIVLVLMLFVAFGLVYLGLSLVSDALEERRELLARCAAQLAALNGTALPVTTDSQ